MATSIWSRPSASDTSMPVRPGVSSTSGRRGGGLCGRTFHFGVDCEQARREREAHVDEKQQVHGERDVACVEVNGENVAPVLRELVGAEEERVVVHGCALHALQCGVCAVSFELEGREFRAIREAVALDLADVHVLGGVDDHGGAVDGGHGGVALVQRARREVREVRGAEGEQQRLAARGVLDGREDALLAAVPGCRDVTDVVVAGGEELSRYGGLQ
eukprot:3504502-Rhodomonas_salina.3